MPMRTSGIPDPATSMACALRRPHWTLVKRVPGAVHDLLEAEGFSGRSRHFIEVIARQRSCPRARTGVSGYTSRVKDLHNDGSRLPVRSTGASHDHKIWRSPLNGTRFTVDGDIKSRHTANGTLKDAGLPKQF